MHLVNQLQVEATCTDESQAFEVRRIFSRLCQEDVAKMMDEICSKYTGEEEWIQIDKLEMDLGYIDTAQLESKLANLLHSNFEKELCNKLKSIPAGQRTISKQLSFTELLTYFLEQGVLPWWAGYPDININEACRKVLDDQPAFLYHFLLDNKINETVWKRLSMQFDDDVITNIVHLFDELVNVKEKIMHWKDDLVPGGKLINSSPGNENLHGKLKRFIVSKAPFFLTGSTLKNDNIVEELAMEFARQNYPAGVSAGWSDRYKDAEKNVEVKTMPADRTAILSLTEDDITQKLLVRHAGIILLSPFFKPLFSCLGLLKGTSWKDDASQQRAVHLLRFIGSGEIKPHEHTLALEKILCGMNISDPVARDIVPDQTEMNEAENLLRSVISHWKVLQNTSTRGLQETFLKRDGILIKKDNGWSLTAERKTEDILLETIPWGYSTISLPWNKNIVYVEW